MENVLFMRIGLLLAVNILLKSANIKNRFQKHHRNILAVINRWKITVKRDSKLGIVDVEKNNHEISQE